MAACTAIFRDDKLNAKDFIANRVLPYSNQQIGGALGGPIISDRAHYFVSYERENEPNTIITSPAGAPGVQLVVPDQAGAEQLPRPRRLAVELQRPSHRAGVVLGLGQSLHAGRGHRASLAGRRPLAARP